VQQVWRNCLIFNGPGDEVTLAGQRVQAAFDAQWRAARLPVDAVTAARAPSGKRKAARSPTRAEEDEAAAAPQAGPSAGGARCAVCQVQKKGKCGTPTAPKACLNRTPGMDVQRVRRDAPGGGSGGSGGGGDAGDAAAATPPAAAATAGKGRVARDLARAEAALREAEAAARAAAEAEAAELDAAQGCLPHDAPSPRRAPPGYAAPPPARLTPAAHAAGAFFFRLPATALRAA
jgi:hypothetical protein